MIEITRSWSIADEEVEMKFVRTGGPGGQNVNKVSTAVQLRFDAWASPDLPERVRERLPGVAGRLLTAAGVLVLTADRHRTQAANRADALERLRELLARAAAPPPRSRRPTKPTFGSKLRRLEGKTRRAGVKSNRSTPGRDD